MIPNWSSENIKRSPSISSVYENLKSVVDNFTWIRNSCIGGCGPFKPAVSWLQHKWKLQSLASSTVQVSSNCEISPWLPRRLKDPELPLYQITVWRGVEKTTWVLICFLSSPSKLLHVHPPQKSLNECVEMSSATPCLSPNLHFTSAFQITALTQQLVTRRAPTVSDTWSIFCFC